MTNKVSVCTSLAFSFLLLIQCTKESPQIAPKGQIIAKVNNKQWVSKDAFIITGGREIFDNPTFIYIHGIAEDSSKLTFFAFGGTYISGNDYSFNFPLAPQQNNNIPKSYLMYEDQNDYYTSFLSSLSSSGDFRITNSEILNNTNTYTGNFYSHVRAPGSTEFMISSGSFNHVPVRLDDLRGIDNFAEGEIKDITGQYAFATDKIDVVQSADSITFSIKNQFNNSSIVFSLASNFKIGSSNGFRALTKINSTQYRVYGALNVLSIETINSKKRVVIKSFWAQTYSSTSVIMPENGGCYTEGLFVVTF